MKTVILKTPVEHGGKTYTELTFREATIGDLVTGSAFTTELAQTVAILAAISDTPLPAFKAIKARDLKLIMEETADLLGNELITTGA
ncbi:Hypothetical protein NGAL_HAMBI1146_58780 [Neorhizobium galegae bv. officinalis]|nr:Hypothetical protein NGAL_HAMBI1146_58780 [Neorhizobium galegae bv. officinalis]